MNDRTLETLGLAEFLTLAARHVQTIPGRFRMLELKPSVTRSEIVKSLDITGECVNFLSANRTFGLSGIVDPLPIIDRIQIEGTILEPKQILQMEKLLSISQQLRALIKNAEPAGSYPHLQSIASSIPDVRHLLSTIGGKILPNGELDDKASSELLLIRKELADRRTRIHRTLESIIRNQSQAVQEEIITFRNDRFVIPVRTDSRNQIPGVVHGLSSSGQTTYIEPLTVINQNNDLVRLHEQEVLEISRILSELTETLRNSLEEIRTIVKTLTELDVSQAKAILASEFQCTRPEISDDQSYELRDARNVLLEYSLGSTGVPTVPISLELDREHPVLVISGPNAGGKTVTLRTLGLISIMAQLGFHVPAREALLPVFLNIFADIGDQQSMAANLSTFTAHMRNIAEMDSELHSNSLVLLDEVGTGTDPDEGAALAIAIINHFREIGITTIASTHYPRLKMWASQTEGVRNASVEFDEKTLRPTYRLILGIAGASSGIEIARRMNIPEGILSQARTLFEPSYAQARDYLRQLKESLDNQESLRMALESEKSAVKEKYSELEKNFSAHEKKLKKEFSTQLERIIEEFKSECDRATKKIKDRIENSRMKKTIEGQSMLLRRKADQLRGKLEPNRSENEPDATGAEETILKGDRVKIRSLDREGTVESMSNETCIISLGNLRYHANLSDLVKTPLSRDSRLPAPPGNTSMEDYADSEDSMELKVIGLTADEALSRVDKFLDSSFLAGTDKIRIIHGHGKGILRKAIAEMLKDHIHVERYSAAPPEQGGGGATIVELKK